MEIDTDLFVNAGMQYGYALDNYPGVCVYQQVTQEFQDILNLNAVEVLEARLKYFGVGESADYLNRLIETDEGMVLAGIRHLGNNRDKPFIFVWPSFEITSPKKLIASVLPFFEIFKPEKICFWRRPGFDITGAEVVQQRFVGRVAEMEKVDVLLSRYKNYYKWYKSEYDKFHRKKPELENRVQINSKEEMDASFDDGLLYVWLQGDSKVGLVSGEREVFLGERAIYLNEILIAQDCRGRGLAHQLLGGFMNVIDAVYLTCDIDSENTPSVKTALRSGQTVFSQEVFVRI